MGTMAGLSTALSVVNTLRTALANPLLKEAFLTFVSSDNLENLKGSVTAVKSLLVDAANTDELPETVRDYINKLKDVVYDADDLFDELVTRAERKQLFDENIFEKVRQLYLSIETSLKVRELRLKLNNIADDHARFKLDIGTAPHRRVRPTETFSHVPVSKVVGRDDDADKVIGMLLDSKSDSVRPTETYFLAIVGIGGVGKTTLANLVFSDTRIKDKFPITLWVCVSDQDGATLDLKQIVLKILELRKCRFDNSSSLEFLQGEYRRSLQGKNFLLVLDDVWNEKSAELENLKKCLMIDGSKSRIIVTTRSKETARLIGDGVHELDGLSDEHSQRLFEITAFGDGEKPPDFVEIGERIVKKTSNIPLSIMVIGTLLYRQPINKWMTFETSGFNRFSNVKNGIMSILEISYYNLDPSLKSCFAYCAIFPKDYVISKTTIIKLWNAQGYIVPFEEAQSLEDATEEHFSVLLQRCFFQDIKKNKDGEIESFKLHDLMHDLAQRVSGEEIYMINSSMRDLEYKVRHVSVSKPINSDGFNPKGKIRSYLMLRSSRKVELGDELLSFEMPKNWGCLRALALQSLNVRLLPDTIGDLLHLRYLNLAYSTITKLPDSIARLHNLQTLDVSYCKLLVEWPKEFTKLVNLTHLYTNYCLELSYMPAGLSKLSRIRTLTEFVVEDETANAKQRVGQLIDLKAISMNLKGGISIRFGKQFKGAEVYDWEGSCLQEAEHLNQVVISFPRLTKLIDHEEIVMEKLKPHPNLRKFSLTEHGCKKIARWGSAQHNWATVLPNLVYIHLSQCRNLTEVPLLSKLQHLKSLTLINLHELEYMEEEVTSSSGSRSLDITFFPSLEYLEVYALSKLRRWWRLGDSSESHCQPAFPILSILFIGSCRSLTSFPHCQSLPKLNLSYNHQELRITTEEGVYTRSYQD